jgi:hypothetical protein
MLSRLKKNDGVLEGNIRVVVGFWIWLWVEFTDVLDL